MSNPLARHGGLSYLHISATDLDRSARFYERVLGWKIERRSATGIRFSDGTGHLIGGFGTGSAGAHEPGMLPYFYVDDIDVAVVKAEEHGQLVDPPHPEGDIRIARVRDPAGNLIGLWQFIAP